VARASEFTWERAAAAHLAVVRDVAGSGPWFRRTAGRATAT